MPAHAGKLVFGTGNRQPSSLSWVQFYGDIVYVWKGQDILNIQRSVRLPTIATILLSTPVSPLAEMQCA